MIHQPPRGARDLLPLDVTQKQWVEARLRQVFESWGYHRIITSSLERLDTLMAGDAIERSAVVQVLGEDEAELGLRPELTASIARAAVTRLAETPHPLRLYYQANVFRQIHQGGRTTPQEYYQAGIELLGCGGLLADAEALLLLSECLASLGLVPHGGEDPEMLDPAAPEAPEPPSWFLILGEAGLTHSLLEPFPEEIRPQVRRSISHLDRLALESLPLSPDLRDYALLLLDLRGEPETVIQQVSQLDLNPSQRQRVANLKDLVELLRDSFKAPSGGRSSSGGLASGASALILDLSLVQTFDYYTGIIFEVVRQTPSGQWLLGQGGRYDQLLSLYHPQGQSHPGIGFSLNIEILQQVLLHLNQLPTFTPPSDCLVVPLHSHAHREAIAYAQKLRDNGQGLRVELYLEDDRSPEDVRAYARQRRLGRVAWIRPGALPDLETLP